MENLNVEINAQGGHEIRTGELPPVHTASGFTESQVSIHSLTNFIRSRVASKQVVVQDAVLVLDNRNKTALFLSDMNRKQVEIYSLGAKFFVEENEVSRAIIDAKTFDLAAFRKWVSRMKPYFFDYEEHRELSDRLLGYSVTAFTEITDKKDNQASFAKNYSQRSDSRLPQFVQIRFECGQVFKTEICFSIRDNNTTFWLECFEYEHWLVDEQRLQFSKLEDTCIDLGISVLER